VSFSNKQPKADVSEEVPYLGVIDPALEKFQRKVDSTPDTKRKTIGYVVIGLIIAVSAAFGFIPGLPRYVHVLVGVPLGFAAFCVGYAFMYLRDKEKRAEDPNYLSLKERNSPAQRMRFGIGALVAFILISLMTKDVIPYILGGIFSISVVMAIYNYVRRTPQEIEREANGEPDPRESVEDLDASEQAVEDASKEETEEYIALVNSLPEEQRKILLNPKLNGALTVIDDDDIKGKKKRKLFRK
jgi:hypothetical protein